MQHFDCYNMGNLDDYKDELLQLYIEVTKLLDDSERSCSSIVNLFYNSEKKIDKAVFGLAAKVVKKKDLCDLLIKESGILQLCDWPSENLARTLITELLWAKRWIEGTSQFIEVISSNRQKFIQTINAKKSASQNKTLNNVDKRSLKGGDLIRFCRVNTIKTSVKKIIKYFQEKGFSLLETPENYNDFIDVITNIKEKEFLRDFNFQEILVFSNLESSFLIRDAKVVEGSLILHDKSSFAASFLLNPEPGSTVLDMCAAPGMKTTMLAAAMKNQGNIYATDINEERLYRIHKIAETQGVSSIITPIVFDSCNIRKLNNLDQCCVDYILVDAPCTGSGMIKRLGQVQDWKHRKDKLHNLQAKLLRNAFAFKNVKRIVYTTCSLYEEENEAVIDDILPSAVENNFVLVNCNERLTGFSPGSDSYKSGSSCLYFIPEKDKTNGFFIAVFESNSETTSNEIFVKMKFKQKDKGQKYACRGTNMNSTKKDCLQNVDNTNNCVEIEESCKIQQVEEKKKKVKTKKEQNMLDEFQQEEPGWKKRQAKSTADDITHSTTNEVTLKQQVLQVEGKKKRKDKTEKEQTMLDEFHHEESERKKRQARSTADDITHSTTDEVALKQQVLQVEGKKKRKVKTEKEQTMLDEFHLEESERKNRQAKSTADDITHSKTDEAALKQQVFQVEGKKKRKVKTEKDEIMLDEFHQEEPERKKRRAKFIEDDITHCTTDEVALKQLVIQVEGKKKRKVKTEK